ncbi:hypothetical protein SCHPADRAFT_948273 [Schizopora paradoxa]|uniref:Uncharacterized protein n=1 Tax=Schizopora paradoxa TaxID=27342 RepID=A0A0H2RFW7_9AGAM|nr:hypothetical protein SCHPADRAFT_948273 [Schizopora paradoxa]
MPRASRFMPDELAHLKSEASAYGDARFGKSLRTFWGRVIPEFFAKFPRALPEGWTPGDKIVQAGSNVQDGVDDESGDEGGDDDADVVETGNDGAPLSGDDGQDDTSSAQKDATDAAAPRVNPDNGPGNDAIKIAKRPRTTDELRLAALGALVKKKTKLIKTWFPNNAKSRSNPAAAAQQQSVGIVASLVKGPIKKRKTKQKAIHAYHAMNREKLDEIIEELWQQEKKSNSKKHGDRLAFQNKYLAARLEEETPEVIDAVNKYREDDILTKLQQLEAMESQALLCPDEMDLPAAEKERLKIGRQRFRFVINQPGDRFAFF